MAAFGPYLLCAACHQDIKEVMYYLCTNCDNRLHKNCVYDSKINNDSSPSILTCVCSECKCKIPKGDNTNTPVRDGKLSKDPFVNVTRRKDRTFNIDESAEGDEEGFDMATLMTEIRHLRQAVNDLTTQNAEIALLRKDVLDLKTQITSAHSDSQKAMAESRKYLAARDAEIIALKATVSQLQHSLGQREQESLRNEIEIAGIPEHEGESLCHLALLTATKIGVELSEQDIDGVFRAGPLRSPLNASSTNSKLPRPIVVRLVRHAKRDQLIKASKVRGNLTSTDIIPGTANKIYLNERLTKSNRSLYREARLLAKQHNFRFCWIRYGCIYVRKAEKKPAIPIRTGEDLNHLISPATEFVETDP